MLPRAIIEKALADHEAAARAFMLANVASLTTLSEKIAAAFGADNRLLVCGNGGSACDALHIAGEFVGRFVNDRRALPAIALSADVGAITAIGNDYGYEAVFARQVEAHGRKGDILIAISTSGGSQNILRALEVARTRGMFTVLLTGEKGLDKHSEADMLLAAPSSITARIQEVHIFALHLIAELVEAQLFAGQISKNPL